MMPFKEYAFAKKTKNQKGMTLLEILITLGIFGVLSAGIFRLSQVAMEVRNMGSLIESLNSLRFAGMQTYRSAGRYPAWDANFPNFTTFNLINLGKVAKEDGINPFNNDTIPFLTFGKTNSYDRKAFALAVEALTQDECKSLVTRTANTFSYIAVEQHANANYRTVPYEKAVANAANPVGVIKSVALGSVNLDLSNLDHTENLCGGPSDEARHAAYTVYLGSL